jgi:hypothetical protein
MPPAAMTHVRSSRVTRDIAQMMRWNWSASSVIPSYSGPTTSGRRLQRELNINHHILHIPMLCIAIFQNLKYKREKLIPTCRYEFGESGKEPIFSGRRFPQRIDG